VTDRQTDTIIEHPLQNSAFIVTSWRAGQQHIKNRFCESVNTDLTDTNITAFTQFIYDSVNTEQFNFILSFLDNNQLFLPSTTFNSKMTQTTNI